VADLRDLGLPIDGELGSGGQRAEHVAGINDHRVDW
jgi:hypothetical protein